MSLLFNKSVYNRMIIHVQFECDRSFNKTTKDKNNKSASKLATTKSVSKSAVKRKLKILKSY